MTPGPYLHIGGDEVKTLTREHYAAFINRVQKIVESHGKQVVGWDEIAAADLLPTAIVQHWRPTESPAALAAKGVKVIVSAANRMYLDMKYDAATALGLNWAAYIEVRDAYDWDPATLVAPAPKSSILGVEAPLCRKRRRRSATWNFSHSRGWPRSPRSRGRGGKPHLERVQGTTGCAGAAMDRARRQLLPLAAGPLVEVLAFGLQSDSCLPAA
jgi:hypothetical protein